MQKYTQRTYDDLQGHLSGIESEVTSATALANELRAYIEELEAEVAKLESRVDELQDELDRAPPN